MNSGPSTQLRRPGFGAVTLLSLVLGLLGCPPGFGADPCASLRCPANSSCTSRDGVARCDCNTGYTGADCTRCDEVAGWHLSADGVTCTDDRCDPDPCDATLQEHCRLGACICDAPLHRGADGITCTDDPCDPSPCDASNHEVCIEGGFCGCAEGYHRASDGQTCTDAFCDPDPCDPANHEVCRPDGCECEALLHRAADGVTCTDDPCDPDPCDAGNHEVCASGLCSCDTDYHLAPDAVTCVSELCDPDPCSAANHEVCDAGACFCDAASGYHLSSNGVTCTTDPCDPNPCSGADTICTGGVCEPLDADPCDPARAVPLVAANSARFVRDGLVHHTTGAGYALGFPHDLITGALVLNMELDDSGQSVAAQVAAQSFPICVPLDSSDDGSGHAFVEDDAVSFSTTATHTGKLAIVAQEGDELIGRFAFEAQQNSGSATTEVEAGVFRLPPR